MRKHSIRALAFIAAVLLTRPPVRAQVAGPLTNDHPIVMEHLIALHDGLSAHIAARDAEDPANAKSRHDGAMRIFGLSPGGYQTLGTILSAAKAQLDAVRTSQSQYLAGLTNGQQHTAPDSAKLQSFYGQQLATLAKVPLDLKAQLSPGDWSNLQAFIAAELVAKIKVGPVNTPVRAPNIQ